MARITFSLRYSDFAVYSQSNVNQVGLTGLTAALIASGASVLLNRAVWEPMTDAEWDELSALLASALSEVESAIE